MKKSNNTIRILAEIAIFAAIAFGLDMLQAGLFKGFFVNGGSIGVAMVPIFVIAYRRGLWPGLLCGLIVSVVQMLGGVYIIPGATYSGGMKVIAPFAQVMLDYVLAYTVVGFAGAFAKMYKNKEEFSMKVIAIVAGTVLGGLLKYACHTLSGGLFWLDPSINFLGVNGGTVWYSFFYNGLYCIPNIILAVIIMILIAIYYPQFLDPEAKPKDKNEELKEEDTNE